MTVLLLLLLLVLLLLLLLRQGRAAPILLLYSTDTELVFATGASCSNMFAVCLTFPELDFKPKARYANSFAVLSTDTALGFATGASDSNRFEAALVSRGSVPVYRGNTAHASRNQNNVQHAAMQPLSTAMCNVQAM